MKIDDPEDFAAGFVPDGCEHGPLDACDNCRGERIPEDQEEPPDECDDWWPPDNRSAD